MQSQSKIIGDNKTPKRSNTCTSAPAESIATDTIQQKRRRILATMITAQTAPPKEDNVETERVADIVEQQINEQPTTKESLCLLAKTIRQTLFEVAEIKERNQERRHRELMQLLEKYMEKDETPYNEKKETHSHYSDNNAAKSQVERNRHQLETSENKKQFVEGEETVKLESHQKVIVVPASSSFDTSSIVEVDDEHIIVETVDEELVVEMQTPLDDIPEISREVSQSIDNSPIKVTKPLTAKPPSSNEFQLMREQMLEMQRRKMADRERKKQLVQQKLVDKVQR